MENDRPGHLERRAGSGAAGFRRQKNPPVASHAGLLKSRFPLPVVGPLPHRTIPLTNPSATCSIAWANWRPLAKPGLVRFDMKHSYLLLALAGTVLFSGCDKQTRLNTEKISLLSQKLMLLQQNQTTQLATIKSQLTSLAPLLDKVNNYYFEKTHEDAIFFHTNTLFLTLTVGRQIEARLAAAETDRQAGQSLLYAYHTNQIHTMYLCNALLEEAMTAQETRLEDKLHNDTRQMIAALNTDLQQQIKQLTPDPAELARRQAMAADLAQIKRDLATITLRLSHTNPPAAQP